jgi:hypothetical protein
MLTCNTSSILAAELLELRIPDTMVPFHVVALPSFGGRFPTERRPLAPFSLVLDGAQMP